MTRLLETIRFHWTGWRLRQAMRPIDRQIRDARRAHKPVRHLLQAKRELILYGLKGGR